MWRHIPRKIGGLAKMSKPIIRNTDGTTTTNTPPPRMGRGGGVKDKKIFEGASERFRREIEQAKVEIVKEEKRSDIETKRKTAYEKATREGASEADRVEYIALSKNLDREIAGEFHQRARGERKKMIKNQSRLPIQREKDDGFNGLSSTDLYTRLYGRSPKSTPKFVDHDPEEEKEMKERERKEAQEASEKYTQDMHKRIDELDKIEPDDMVVDEFDIFDPDDAILADFENQIFADQFDDQFGDELDDQQLVENYEKQETVESLEEHSDEIDSNMAFTPEQELEFGSGAMELINIQTESESIHNPPHYDSPHSSIQTHTEKVDSMKLSAQKLLRFMKVKSKS